MKTIFERYKGKYIGINCTDSVKIDVLELFVVQDDYFGVLDRTSGFRAYYPYESLLGVFEKDDGFKEKNQVFSLMVNVNHFVLYKGSIGVGVIF